MGEEINGERVGRPGWCGTQSLLIPLGAAAIVQLLVALCTPCVPMNDTVWYLAQTFQYPIPRPSDFYALTQPAPAWDVVYPPGLPWLLDAFMLVFRRYWIIAFMLMQHGLRLGTVWMIGRTGRVLDRPRRGWWCALLYACHAPSAIYCQALLSEVTFTFLLTAALWRLAAAVTRPGAAPLRPWWVGGVLLAAASLVRFQVALPVAVAFAALVAPASPSAVSLRRRLRQAACVLVPGTAALLVILSWNGMRYGRWAVGTHVGRHFFDRAFCLGRLAAPGNPDYERVLAAGNDTGFAGPDGRPVTTLRGAYWYDVYPRLRLSGLSLVEADRLMGRAAIASMRGMPLTYLGTLAADILRPEAGRVMSHDGFIPEWAWRPGRRPPPDRHPWLRPGQTVGVPAEVLARRPIFANYLVPDAPPLPGPLRHTVLDALLLLPEWNGLWIWLVLAATVLLVRDGERRALALFAFPFWGALLFSVAIHGPIPRYYTALLPLALWLGVFTITRWGGALHVEQNGTHGEDGR